MQHRVDRGQCFKSSADIWAAYIACFSNHSYLLQPSVHFQTSNTLRTHNLCWWDCHNSGTAALRKMQMPERQC
eukprot:365763-Chlamydomonas_euryale.AAC.35